MSDAPRPMIDRGVATPYGNALPADLAADLERPVVVLDTSALMADSSAHLAYPGSQVVVPLTVIDELDRNKTRSDSAGRNARDFLRTLETYRRDHGGDITAAVEIPGESTIRVEPNGLRVAELDAHNFDTSVADHRIIAAALGLRGDGHPHVRLVSNDMALRLKAAVLGLEALEHTPGHIGTHAPHRRGFHTLPLSWEAIEGIKQRGPTDLSTLPPQDRDLLTDVLENEFIIAEGTAITARRRGDSLVRVPSQVSAWGLKPRSKEQAFALDLLTDDDVNLVALRGRAGTGKTLLALAAGLEAVFERNTHDRLMILRPMYAVGNQEMGFLPGDVADKTAPWFAAVVDAMVSLTPNSSYRQCAEQLSMWIEAEKVELSPLTFLRGRSLSGTYVLLDEAQNTEGDAAKTVISRLGEGSKLVLTGDDEQIDQPFASSVTCGLNVTVDAFAGLDLFGQVHFSKGERSRLADLAAERM